MGGKKRWERAAKLSLQTKKTYYNNVVTKQIKTVIEHDKLKQKKTKQDTSATRKEHLKAEMKELKEKINQGIQS